MQHRSINKQKLLFPPQSWRYYLNLIIICIIAISQILINRLPVVIPLKQSEPAHDQYISIATSWIHMSLGIGRPQFPELIGVTMLSEWNNYN